MSSAERQRSAAAFRAKHRLRELQQEPRLSVADEENLTDLSHRRQRVQRQQDATALIEQMTRDLERVQSLIAGDTRGYVREVRHGLAGFTKMVNR